MRVVSLAVLLLAVPLFAQRYDDTITVNVVDVPVYVERFGKPITGLTRDDFELYVNGQPHPIEYFDVQTEEFAEVVDAAEPPTAAPVDLKRRRLTVLLFDVVAPLHSLNRARKAAAKFVENSAPGDTFAVATVSSPGVLFLVPFTNDRVAVQRAIATLRPSRASDPFRVATLSVERDAWDGGHPDAFDPPAIAGRYVNASIDMDGGAFDFSSRGLIDNLMDLADRLAALDGLKEVVLLSEGDGDPEAGFTWAGQMASKVRLHKRYRVAGVILNAIDISTPDAPAGVAAVRGGSAQLPAPDFMASAFLWELALDTGGIATSSMPELQKRSRAAYVIGFRAPASQPAGSITVRVKNQPLLTDVRYRKSYTLGRETKDEGLFLADTLLNDIPQNGVTLDVDVHDATMAARIPGVELLSYAAESHRLRLDVYFYIFDTQQHPVAWNRMEVVVDLEQGREFLSANPYTMSRAFDLQPGRYVAKALVRVAGTDRVGFQRTEFEVAP